MDATNLQDRANVVAAMFGAALRERRIASGLTQDELALATGVGRRFLIDLEAGKASCQLGRSLLVADALGLKLLDLLGESQVPTPPTADLPPP